MSDFKGKGSKHRPHHKKTFNDNFDRIFGVSNKLDTKLERITRFNALYANTMPIGSRDSAI